ncbi:uncharacterized protein NEMAJ01_2104 [Nematocida major]|uniref:uncharacterized protein n=1 Tax=Nematocida major TaxID=1912982 RepID=UPI002008AA0B|nr:uncharacterized protein NEMAJ01_2104 [Nematocida major]KAH9387208.1 hypothetical protein NEMAJ01_2104 [Nematocida major]
MSTERNKQNHTVKHRITLSAWAYAVLSVLYIAYCTQYTYVLIKGLLASINSKDLLCFNPLLLSVLSFSGLFLLVYDLRHSVHKAFKRIGTKYEYKIKQESVDMMYESEHMLRMGHYETGKGLFKIAYNSIFILPLQIPSVFPNASISSFLTGILVLGLLFSGFCLGNYLENQESNVVKHYMLGSLEKRMQALSERIGGGQVGGLLTLGGVFFMYTAASLVLHGPYSGSFLVNIAVLLYAVWSMLMYAVISMYAGYVYSEYRIRYMKSAGFSLPAIVYVAKAVLKSMHKICGISIIYGVCIFQHMFRSEGSSTAFKAQKMHMRRYDRIEMKVINYIVQEDYYSGPFDRREKPMSMYWVCTKSMFVGERIFAEALLLVFPLTYFLLVFATFSTPLQKTYTIAYGLLQKALNIVLITESSSNTFLLREQTEFMLYMFLMGMAVFFFLVGRQSFTCMWARVPFLLKDAHFDDPQKVTEKSWDDLIRDIHLIIYSQPLPNEMSASEAALKQYDTRLISILNQM